VFGAEAGNCALRYMTTGGIYIGGVIAAKIASKMQDGTFMQAFLDKGRMESILKDMPVQIIANDDCGLIGAARYTLVQKAFKGSTRAAD
jgi:glucokinase